MGSNSSDGSTYFKKFSKFTPPMKVEEFQAEITWRDIMLTTPKGKRLLSGISGQIRPGTMTALMGSSGAGKTTLMNVLAGRTMDGLTLNGDILLNGANRDPESWPRVMSYVNQSFHSYELQSVFETLSFACIEKGFASKEMYDRTNELLNLLGLTSSRDTYVKQLSGGEKIRLSIGLELIGNPPLIFLDEPTSGLDSFNAINILELLRKISSMGKTVIVTIHQPSYKMLKYFDSIYLMSLGGVVFDGSVDDCIRFFNQAGFQTPDNTNPADHFLDIIAVDYRSPNVSKASIEKIDSLKSKWKAIEKEPQPAVFDRIRCPPRKGFKVTIPNIVVRNLKNIFRNTSYMKVRGAQRVCIALLFGLTFFQISISTVNLYTFRGILTFLVINELFGISGPLLNAFPQEIKIITRERQSGLYSGYEAYYSKFLSEFLTLLCFEIPYITSVYYIVGLNYSFSRYITFLIILISECTCGIALGLTVGTISPTPDTAQALGITFSVLFVLYSGGFSQPATTPPVVRWIMWISPVQYTFRAAVQNQLTGAINNGQYGEDIISSFGLSGIGVWPCICIILGYAFVLTAVGAAALHYKTRNKIAISRKVERV